MSINPSKIWFIYLCVQASKGRFNSMLFKELGFSDDEIGLVLALCSGTSLISPVIGNAADQYGTLKVIRISTAVGAVSFLLVFLSQYIGELWIRLIYVCACQTLACFALNSIVYVLDAYTINWIRRSTPPEDSERVVKAKYGTYRWYGAVSWGLVSLSLGALMDLTGTTKVMFASMSFFAAIFLLILHKKQDEVMDEDIQKRNLSVYSRLNKLFSEFKGDKLVLYTFFLLMYALSAGMSLVENLLFLYFLEDLKTSYFVMGLSVVITILFEIPLFQLSGILMDKLGDITMLMIGVLAYSFRVYGYTMISESDKLVVLLFEPLHGFTIACVKVASVTYISNELASEDSEALSQTVLGVVRALGMITGTITGGYLQEHFGSTFLYRFYGSFVAVCAMIYLASVYLSRWRSKNVAIGDKEYQKLKIKTSDPVNGEEIALNTREDVEIEKSEDRIELTSMEQN